MLQLNFFFGSKSHHFMSPILIARRHEESPVAPHPRHCSRLKQPSSFPTVAAEGGRAAQASAGGGEGSLHYCHQAAPFNLLELRVLSVSPGRVTPRVVGREVRSDAALICATSVLSGAGDS